MTCLEDHGLTARKQNHTILNLVTLSHLCREALLDMETGHINTIVVNQCDVILTTQRPTLYIDVAFLQVDRQLRTMYSTKDRTFVVQ